MNHNFGNVWLIDSGGLWLTGDSSATGAFFNSEIAAIRFSSTSGGKLELTAESNTALNVVFSSLNSLSDNYSDTLAFTRTFKCHERLFVRTCVNGTGWVYFS